MTTGFLTKRQTIKLYQPHTEDWVDNDKWSSFLMLHFTNLVPLSCILSSTVFLFLIALSAFIVIVPSYFIHSVRSRIFSVCVGFSNLLFCTSKSASCSFSLTVCVLSWFQWSKKMVSLLDQTKWLLNEIDQCPSIEFSISTSTCLQYNIFKYSHCDTLFADPLAILMRITHTKQQIKWHWCSLIQVDDYCSYFAFVIRSTYSTHKNWI